MGSDLMNAAKKLFLVSVFFAIVGWSTSGYPAAFPWALAFIMAMLALCFLLGAVLAEINP